MKQIQRASAASDVRRRSPTHRTQFNSLHAEVAAHSHGLQDCRILISSAGERESSGSSDGQRQPEVTAGADRPRRREKRSHKNADGAEITAKHPEGGRG